MSEKPIIFKGPMVRAILDGRKTVTRRVIKPQPSNCAQGFVNAISNEHIIERLPISLPPFPAVLINGLSFKMPYKPGDLLWVRETWRPRKLENGTGYFGSIESRHVEYKIDEDYKNRMKCVVASSGLSYIGEPKPESYYSAFKSAKWFPDKQNWNPSIFMPRWAARLWLRVVDVRPERLQDITADEANREGIACSDCWTSGTPYSDFPHDDRCGCVNKFGNLWNEINGKRAPWESNPWVWRIEFARAEKAV